MYNIQLSLRFKEGPGDDSGTAKKGKSKHSSSVFIVSGDTWAGEDGDDIFSASHTSGIASPKKTGKAKTAVNKDTSAIFSAVDQGTYLCICTIFDVYAYMLKHY